MTGRPPPPQMLPPERCLNRSAVGLEGQLTKPYTDLKGERNMPCLVLFGHQVAIARGSAACFASEDPLGPGSHAGHTNMPSAGHT